MQLLAGESPVEELGEGAGDFGDLYWCFVNKFQSEMPDAGFQPAFQMSGGLLCLRTEDGIAATDVGHNRVGPAIFVAHGNAMFFAGVAAILEGCAGGKEAAEHAMFHVEDGEVLIGDDFQIAGSGGGGECGDLG